MPAALLCPSHRAQQAELLLQASASPCQMAFSCCACFTCLGISGKGIDRKLTHEPRSPQSVSAPLILRWDNSEGQVLCWLPEVLSGPELRLLAVVICLIMILLWLPSLPFLPALLPCWCFLQSLPKHNSIVKTLSQIGMLQALLVGM